VSKDNVMILHTPAGSAGEGWPVALAAATRFAAEIVSRPSHDRWRPPLLDSTPAD
jgi:hypothetical protein